jgi:cytochrome c-type biogenesis protein CcmH
MPRLKFAVVTVLLGCLLAPAVFAADARPTSDDPALDRRVQRLANELRCLVCQNQTIADSNAELAVDLRKQVREQLRQGRTEEEILAYMVNRYGDFVLYRPPLKAQTLLLWMGPFVLMAGGLFVLLRSLRRRRDPDEKALSQAKIEEAAQLLRGDGRRS